MNRPVSPLLHDYKPSAERRPAKPKALQWFAVGLGIPLIGVALISGLGSRDPQPAPAPETPIITATEDAPPVFVEALPELETPVEPVAEEPQFDELVLTVGRGDTMEKLFRKNQLDIGHLMEIAQLDEAKRRFRKIKPGDVFEVKHDDGQVISLYSKLNLTSGLQIEKQDDGFSASVVEHPIEVRKRHAYGVISTSLFESAAEAGLSDKVIMNVAGIFAWDVDFE